MIHFLVAMLFMLPLLARWLVAGSLSSGDWGYRFMETARTVSPWSVTWSSYFGDGLGGSRMILAPLDTWYIFVSKIASFFSISPDISERFIWFYPLLPIALYSAVKLARTITTTSWSAVAVVYVLNTYFLSVLSGGQMGVIWAIAFAPLVVYYGINLADRIVDNEKAISVFVVRLSLATSLQLMFDARILYISLLTVFIYFCCLLVQQRWSIRRICLLMGYLLATGAFVFAVHAFWLLPLILFPISASTSLGQEYISLDAVRFFSFADFSHAFVWLHPNWPENIFGKTYFMQPEFLIIPILAYSSLFFVLKEKGTKRTRILYFSLLGLIGSFLVKGTNPLFGGVYEWLFQNIPGFIMFRDPTKFYVMVSLSYSVLIPYAFESIQSVLQSRLRNSQRFSIHLVMPFTVIVVGLLLLGNVFFGTMHGVFIPKEVPQEYVILKNYIVAQEGFYRILWVPQKSRYGYFDDNKPAISLNTLSLASPSAFITWIQEPENDRQLARYAVKYIVVPTDPKGELFVTNREYDDALRQSVIDGIEQTGRFARQNVGDGLAIYAVKTGGSHAYYGDLPKSAVDIRRISATEYRVSVPKGNTEPWLTFSETYNPHWRLEVSGYQIKPRKTDDNLQEYVIPRGYTGDMSIIYLPQRAARFGMVISGTALGLLILLYIKSKLT